MEKIQTEIHDNDIFTTTLLLDPKVLSSLKKTLGKEYDLEQLKNKIIDKLRRNNGDDKHILVANKLCYLYSKGEIQSLDISSNGEYWLNQSTHLSTDNFSGSFNILHFRRAEKQLGYLVSGYSIVSLESNYRLIRKIAEIEFLDLLGSFSGEHPGEVAQELLINQFGLNDKNGYCFLQEDKTIGNFIVEAANNSTMGLDVEGWNEKTSVETILEEAASSMQDFDAEEEFEVLWSREFGNHNGFSAFEFVEMLQEDEAQFHEAAEEIRDYLRQL
jgi:hypothetical protein